jgi:hypothetical protein
VHHCYYGQFVYVLTATFVFVRILQPAVYRYYNTVINQPLYKGSNSSKAAAAAQKNSAKTDTTANKAAKQAAASGDSSNANKKAASAKQSKPKQDKPKQDKAAKVYIHTPYIHTPCSYSTQVLMCKCIITSRCIGFCLITAYDMFNIGHDRVHLYIITHCNLLHSMISQVMLLLTVAQLVKSMRHYLALIRAKKMILLDGINRYIILLYFIHSSNHAIITRSIASAVLSKLSVVRCMEYTRIITIRVAANIDIVVCVLSCAFLSNSICLFELHHFELHHFELHHFEFHYFELHHR